MSVHGRREAQLRATAIAWRDRVSRDMASAGGVAAMSQCKTSVTDVEDLVDRIAGFIAAGETAIGMPRAKRAAAAFLIARGHVARIGDQLRPIRDGQLI